MKNKWKQLEGMIEGTPKLIGVHGLESLHTAIFMASLQIKKNIVYLSDNDYNAKQLSEKLKRQGCNNVIYLPSRQFVFYHIDAYSHDLVHLRVRALTDLLNAESYVLCTSIDNFFDKLPEKDWFFGKKLSIHVSQVLDREELIHSLVTLMYERVSIVEAPGQFSLRGSILDCFPIGQKHPCRIEFFDDEIDSIRIFSQDNQRSLETIESLELLPADEILFDSVEEILNLLQKDITCTVDKAKNVQSGSFVHRFEEIVEHLKEGIRPSNPMLVLPYHPHYKDSLFSYLENTCIVMDQPEYVLQRIENCQEDILNQYTNLFESGEALSGHQDMFFSKTVVKKYLEDQIQILLMPFLKPINELSYDKLFDLKWQEVIKYSGKLDWFARDMKEKLREGYFVEVCLSQEEKINHFVEEMSQLGIIVSRDYNIYGPGIMTCMETSLEKGFEWREEKYILLTDNEIFTSNALHKAKKRRQKGKNIISFSDLHVHDYVVHEKHGVGKYIGITQLKVQEIRKDYLTIEYDKGDRLFIPVEQMDLIQKYIGADAATPKLNKLGGQEWNKTKYSAKKAIESMAEDLIQLYAKRAAVKGFSFSRDSIWQSEFEEAFPYEETEDQLRSIEEIKKDMEESKPMDRLLCGDVGFGKTEVALRAVFKAVQDSKQVAILVPTTILAQQHYNTIETRFQNFPVKVQMLSRFRTDTQQKEILKGVKDGRIDIIIGTHRLLSEDVKFKDLGLLVVDEEQRFGVKHKERLKEIKANVDVLTLTATPIPRTLHMSMVGIRDLSVIEEPPHERHPIQTFVVEQNEHLIRDAVMRELSRGGQIFYVYNRVRGIQRISSQIQKLVPEARIAVAHGQMGERELENVMIDFMNHEYDVLVCTTIIETGLDISNVNTMLIQNADQLGLSQLYQLRGRVGRSNRLAFAYLTYEKDKVLTEVATKRLKAIKEFTEFGSGFKIAMRDLEIRGAGNLLGAEQHGHMMAIGYDLYVKYLEAAVSKFKTGVDTSELETVVEILADAYIPNSFVEDEQQRIDIYKRIASISDLESMSEVVDELIDRYGDVPSSCMQLIKIAYIKSLAQRIGIEEVKQDRDRIILRFKNESYLQLPAIEHVMKAYPMKIAFDFSKQYVLIYQMPMRDINKVLVHVEELLKTLVSFHFPEIQI